MLSQVIDQKLLTVFNDDIYYIILSFLPINDLLQVELLSKHMRICQLCSDDRYWEVFCMKYVKAIFDECQCNSEEAEKVLELCKKFKLFKSDFKKHFVEIWQIITKVAEKNYKKSLRNIEKPIVSQFNKSLIALQFCMVCMRKLKDYSTTGSQVVSNLSTDVARRCLTSQIGRDEVRSS